MANDSDFLGALASNAGDDFHVLWATREMLRLLDPAGDVTAVKVEGPPPDDVHTDLGEHGQAVDIALVRSLSGTTRYRYLQLKYSAANPEKHWTWSRLLTPRAKTKPLSSVLGKLAGLMKSVQFEGDFAILTNQPLSEDVASDVARLIDNAAGQATEDASLVAKLTQQLGLTETELNLFLQAWDRDAFASASRLSIETAVIQRLANMYDADARDDANLIARRVATLMLPESRNEPPVTREQLLVWLGVGSQGMAFPAPSSISPADPYLRRDVAINLRDALVAAQAKPLRVHAGGGCGKTSLLCDLPSLLPAGSELFLYDSYGGGLFLASDQKRHSPEQAFVQIGNEIAARLRTPLLVRRSGSLDVFQAFRNRVSIASAILAERNPEALLVLGFDAVDNARTGANHWHEPCFLDALAQASGWPDNVRVLVSCRTARRDGVGPNALFEDFEVQPFDIPDTSALIALWQPAWRQASAPTFHDLTGGNPRRLIYAINGLPGDGEARAIERLMPKAQGIDPLFERRVAEAGAHLGSSERVWQLLDALARLPRPVPAHILANLAGITPEEISDIASDVGGIAEREEGWSFHDEDFEAFVIDRAEDDGHEMLQRAADLLYANRSEDRYAATGVAEVLVAAGRLSDLYALVTQDEPASKVLSPLEAQFVWSRRLALAIRCCREASDIANACSLLIASAEAIRRARLLEELTVNHLELSLRFAGDEANRLILVGQSYRTQRAQLRIELARQLAETHPEAARANLRWWHAHLRDAQSAKEQDRPRIGADEIASEYEAKTCLVGEEQAFDRLFAWTPQSYLKQTLATLVARSAGRKLAPLCNAIDARAWPPRALAPLLAASLLAGAKITDPVMSEGLARLSRASSARWHEPLENWVSHSSPLRWDEAVLLLCECAIGYESLRPHVALILERALPEPDLNEPQDLHRLRSAGARHARAYTLREKLNGQTLDVGGWLPPLRQVPQQPKPHLGRRHDKPKEAYWNETREETRTAFSRFVNAARATLDIAANPEQSWQQIAKALDVSNIYHERPIRDPDAATLLMRAHLIHAALNRGNVADLVAKMRKVLRGWSADNIARALDLAKALALLPHGHDAALILLAQLAEEIMAAALSASERVKQLSDCARTALPLDEGLAGYLFGMAVEAAGTVDHEAQSALAAAGAIAVAGLGGTRRERAALAVRLADAAGAVAETLDVGGDFNWPDVVAWTAHADLPSGLAIASRLHDQGVVSFSRTLPALFEAAPALTLPQRYALAQLTDEMHPDSDTAFGAAQDLPVWAVKDALTMTLMDGDPRAFLEKLAELSAAADPAARSAIAEFDRHREAFESWDSGKEEDDGAADGTGSSEGVQPAPLKDIEAIRAALSEGTGDHKPDAYHYRRVAECIASLALRVPFLEIARNLSGTDGELGKAIPAILEPWSNYPPVQIWAKNSLPSYLAGSLRHLFEWNYRDAETVEAALLATGLDEQAQADIVLEAIERTGSGMSADLLLVLTGIIAGRAPAATRIGLYGELLQRVESRASHPAKVPLLGLEAPDDIAQCVARALFAAMGDVDRRVRWRAAYGALALMRGGDPAWDKLVRCLAATDEDVFSGPPFYRYGALEQLMMVLQRAALEQPATVARHAGLILDTIRQEPHVVIRELGRSTLLDLAKDREITLEKDEEQFLSTLNRSQLVPAKPSRSRGRTSASFAKAKERPYHFDDTDAIPYWYSPVTRLFNIPLEAFLDRMQRWIHDEWGYGDKATHWDREPRLTRITNESDHVSRRHGTRPTVERLSHHIEWHAMMCAVGEMVADCPLIDRPHIQAEFHEWLERAMPTMAPYWASDLRAPPPLEPRFWQYEPTGCATYADNRSDHQKMILDWASSVDPEVFDAEVTTVDGEIMVGANFRLRWSDAEQKVDIDSALVTPETAMALGRALTTIRNRMDYALPGLYHDDIEKEGFELSAWLDVPERGARGDKHDARRGSVEGVPLSPTGAARAVGLTFDFSQSGWLTPTGAKAFKLAQWGRDDGANGGGWRACAPLSFLTDFLRRAGKSLILNVEIARHVRDEEDDVPTRWALYILDASGSLNRVQSSKRDLGRYLVRREGLTGSVDTLGRWMLHYAAELDARRTAALPRDRGALTRKINEICRAFAERAIDRDEGDFDFD